MKEIELMAISVLSVFYPKIYRMAQKARIL